MPITLPALTRRSFLKQLAAAGCVLTAAPRLLAETEADTWALLADTHIAGDKAFTNRNVKMADNLDRVIREIGEEKTVAAALVCGDCAFGSGQAADYRTLAEMVVPLRARTPVHFLLGNHDHRERFWDGLAGTKESPLRVADRHVGLVKGRHVNWYLLDSLETTNVTPGLLGQEQLDWLARTLDAHPKTPALVVIHHNPGITGNMGLKDTVALFEIIRPRKQVKAYIFGHTHAWSAARDDHGLHLINLPPVSYVFTDTAPAGWVLARADGEALHLRLNCIDRQHPEHGQELRLAYR